MDGFLASIIALAGLMAAMLLIGRTGGDARDSGGDGTDGVNDALDGGD